MALFASAEVGALAGGLMHDTRREASQPDALYVAADATSN